jgi:hypothetical protein
MVLLVYSMTRCRAPLLAGPTEVSEPLLVPLPKTLTSEHCSQFESSGACSAFLTSVRLK